MAIFNREKKPKKPSMQQIGTMYDTFQDELSRVFDTSSITSTDLRTIADDETVFSGLNFLTSSIGAKLGEYSNKDPAIKEFINFNFENMVTTLKRRAEAMLYNTFVFGWSAAEKLWYLRDGKIELGDLAVYPSDTMVIEIDDRARQIKSIKQTTMSGEVEIPIEKMVMFRLGEGLYGNSYIKKCYRPWKFKQVLFKLWAIGMEKYTLPIVWAKSGGDQSTMLTKLRNIWSQTSIVTDLETDVQLLQQQPGSDFGQQFRTAIEYGNYLIYRALNLPQLLLGTETSGAYALGKIHFKMFEDICRSYAGQFADSLIDQLVTQMIDYNFPNAETYGQISIVEEPDVEDREKIARFISKMIEAGVLNAMDYNDNSFARLLSGIPEVVGGAATIEKWKKEGESDADVRDAVGDKRPAT